MGACGARSELELLGVAPASEPDEQSCFGFDATIELANLEVLVVIDASGSMEGATELGGTKWQALTEAMQVYVADPESSGTSMGVSFFPKLDETVNRFCSDDFSCGQPGACTPIGVCDPTGGICQTDTQCVGGSCQSLGVCQNGENYLCDLSDDCGSLGACIPGGYCANHISCDPADYAIAAVGQLPQDAAGIMTAITSHPRDGFTPTLPALEGVVTAAIGRAQNNPSNKVVVVLATDGLPTACDDDLLQSGLDDAIDNLAAVAAQGAGSEVQTFVIGVFSPEEQEQAETSLDAIAVAGGTDQAYVVTTNEDVANLLLEALTEVRRAGRCEYAIPADADPTIAYTSARVRITTSSGDMVWADYRNSAADCHPVDGGFHYDAVPTAESAPNRIILCPATCAHEPDTIFVSCP